MVGPKKDENLFNNLFRVDSGRDARYVTFPR